MSNFFNTAKSFLVALWNSPVLSDEEIDEIFNNEDGNCLVIVALLLLAGAVVYFIAMNPTLISRAGDWFK